MNTYLHARRALALVAAVYAAGCAKGDGKPPKPQTQGAEQRDRDATPPPSTIAVPIVPEAVATKIGSARVIVAMEGGIDDASPLAQFIPAELVCRWGLIRNASALVFMVSEKDHFSVFATGLAEEDVRACLPEWKHAAGVTSREVDGQLRLAVLDRELALSVRDAVLSLEEVGWRLPESPPTSVQRKELAQLPADAGLWVFARGFPPVSVGVETLVVWSTRTEESGTITLVAIAEDKRAAKEIDSVIVGIKRRAQEEGFAFEESWLKRSSKNGRAMVELTLPSAVLKRLQARP
jgi:hypothetical protein